MIEAGGVMEDSSTEGVLLFATMVYNGHMSRQQDLREIHRQSWKYVDPAIFVAINVYPGEAHF